MSVLLSLVGSYVFTLSVVAQEPPHSREWWFWPDYTLDRNAKHQIGPRIDAPVSSYSKVQSPISPLLFFGHEPTERIAGFYPADSVPVHSFTVEMWLLPHVSNDVGVVTAFRSRSPQTDPAWFLGMYGNKVVLSLDGEGSDFASGFEYTMTTRGWKQYWLHVAAVYSGDEVQIFLNGELKKSVSTGALRAIDKRNYQLEVASYLNQEPYMQTGDLLKSMRLTDRALSPKEITTRFHSLQKMVQTGQLYPDLFHFNAGPYLQYAKPDQMGFVWETSEPSNTIIEYSTELPLSNQVKLNNLKLDKESKAYEGASIQKYLLKGLEPGQGYFYQMKSISASGEVIESGVSTFKTPAEGLKAFSFGVIGDTEARPHVNNRVAKLLWDERPEFLLNLGDLTDGGTADFKYQWNYEYFYGMNQLVSRIPVYPVAGNGEEDLYWFFKYHMLPEEGMAYYKFSYGNADFFLLNSNQRDEFTPGGEQYEWLKKELQGSTAEWKFVAHHHAPYSADEDDYGDSWKGASSNGDPVLREIVPLYEEYGVDLVMFGHLHTYQRTHAIKASEVTQHGGVTYIQAGGAGGNLEDFAPTRSWFSAKTFRGHHYLMVEVFGNELELRMYDSEGQLKDFLKRSK